MKEKWFEKTAPQREPNSSLNSLLTVSCQSIYAIILQTNIVSPVYKHNLNSNDEKENVHGLIIFNIL